MAKINDGTMKNWIDGDKFHASDYKQDRDILRAAINDNDGNVRSLQVGQTGIEQRVSATETKTVQQDGRLTGLESRTTSTESKVTSVESKNTAQDGRLTGLETTKDNHESRLGGLEVNDGSQNNKIGDLESSVYSILAPSTFNGLTQRNMTFDDIGIGYVDKQLDPVRSQLTSVTTSLSEIVTVNVKKYGAKGDGVTDDTVALQTAINSLGSGEELIIPATNSYYKITQPINIPMYKALKITGIGSPRIKNENTAGLDCIVIGDPAFKQDDINCSLARFEITGLNLEGNPLSGNGITNWNAHNFLIHNCYIHHHGGNGIYNYRGYVTYWDKLRVGVNSGNGIHFTNECHAASISKSQVFGNATLNKCGILIEGSSNARIENTDIEGNYIGLHVTGNNDTLNGVDTPFVNENTIVDACYFENNTDYSIKLGEGTQAARATMFDGCFFWCDVTKKRIILMDRASLPLFINCHFNNQQITTTANANGVSYVKGLFNTCAYTYADSLQITTAMMLPTDNVSLTVNAGSYLTINDKVGGKQFTLWDSKNGVERFTVDGAGNVLMRGGYFSLGGKKIYYAGTIPVAGSYNQGDYVKNTTPTIQGSAGSRYVTNGWIRITTGSTHVVNTDWVLDKILTGD